MPKFVLEIGTEEMPARFLPLLQEELQCAMSKTLEEGLLDYTSIRPLATPRRLALIIDGLAEMQRTNEEEVTGPPKKVAFDAEGNPTKAAAGFAKTHGIDLAQVYTIDTPKGEYLAAKKIVGGQQTLELLPEYCEKIISGLQFPKSMHWGSGEFTFGRPIRWILALFGSKTISFSIAGIESSNMTCGHRIMGFGPWEVADADGYESVIAEKAKVVLDPSVRSQEIVRQAQELARNAGGEAVINQKLLEEVSGLVEYPNVVLGNFDPSFLELPREALLTSMESHQKSFGVEKTDGSLLPHFLCTINLEPVGLEIVRKGWERVLKARLEDGRFFWKTDLAKELQDWLSMLDNVIFLGPLGSMGDKSRRLEKLCAYLAESVAPEIAVDLARAGLLAKADLVSEMVGEFDDLQGIMGGIYARKKGESEIVAEALYEQYLPAGPDSPVPGSLPGALLSIADKIDTLVGCFGLNMVPTGANDPYALRRQCLGVCRIIMEKELRLDLSSLVDKALEAYGSIEWKLSTDELRAKLLDFMGQRLKNYFTSQSVPTLVAEAGIGAGINDVWALSKRIEALDAFSKEADFEQAVLTFKRAGNIIRKQGEEAGQTLDGAYAADLFQESQEKSLAEKLEGLEQRFNELLAQDAFPELLGLLRELRPFVDAFFDNVMVMCEEVDLRVNRLNLLYSLVERLGKVADFNALQI